MNHNYAEDYVHMSCSGYFSCVGTVRERRWIILGQLPCYRNCSRGTDQAYHKQRLPFSQEGCTHCGAMGSSVDEELAHRDKPGNESKYTYMCGYVGMYVHIRVCRYVRRYIYVCVGTYVHICVCRYVCTYTCV